MNISFYTLGTPFHGRTLVNKPLGGSESAVIYVARSLASLGNKVSVFCNCDRPGVYDGVTYESFSQIVPASNSALFDVCIFSRVLDPIYQVQTRARILWLHDTAQVKAYEQAIPALKDLIDRYFFIGNWQKDDYLKTYKTIPTERIYVTHNGVDETLFSAPVARDKNKLIYINTLYRGLDVLLDIFPSIRHEVPTAQLHLFTGMSLYGDSFSEWEHQLKPLYDKAKEQAGVHLHPPIIKQNLAKELLSSYLALYPSHFKECCSISSLECQAAGTPMITSDLAGLRDTIVDGESGELVPVDDPVQMRYSPVYRRRFLAATMELLRNEEKWNQLSQNARRRMGEKYTWDLIAQKWLTEFATLLH
jgi:glycosyltransferase involved in cell wall biosynthesis